MIRTKDQENWIMSSGNLMQQSLHSAMQQMGNIMQGSMMQPNRQYGQYDATANVITANTANNGKYDDDSNDTTTNV